MDTQEYEYKYNTYPNQIYAKSIQSNFDRIMLGILGVVIFAFLFFFFYRIYKQMGKVAWQMFFIKKVVNLNAHFRQSYKLFFNPFRDNFQQSLNVLEGMFDLSKFEIYLYLQMIGSYLEVSGSFQFSVTKYFLDSKIKVLALDFKAMEELEMLWVNDVRVHSIWHQNGKLYIKRRLLRQGLNQLFFRFTITKFYQYKVGLVKPKDSNEIIFDPFLSGWSHIVPCMEFVGLKYKLSVNQLNFNRCSYYLDCFTESQTTKGQPKKPPITFTYDNVELGKVGFALLEKNPIFEESFNYYEIPGKFLFKIVWNLVEKGEKMDILLKRFKLLIKSIIKSFMFINNQSYLDEILEIRFKDGLLEPIIMQGCLFYPSILKSSELDD